MINGVIYAILIKGDYVGLNYMCNYVYICIHIYIRNIGESLDMSEIQLPKNC